MCFKSLKVILNLIDNNENDESKTKFIIQRNNKIQDINN